jgi:predicted DCC family thiol-disulfide oxidoreductase YuxK
MTPALRRDCAHAVHVLTAHGHILRGARAVLFFLELTGWGRFARFLARSPLIWAFEFGYRWVAAHRTFSSRWLFREE